MHEELSVMTTRKYGWVRDLPDQRDRKFRAAARNSGGDGASTVGRPATTMSAGL